MEMTPKALAQSSFGFEESRSFSPSDNQLFYGGGGWTVNAESSSFLEYRVGASGQYQGTDSISTVFTEEEPVPSSSMMIETGLALDPDCEFDCGDYGMSFQGSISVGDVSFGSTASLKGQGGFGEISTVSSQNIFLNMGGDFVSNFDD